MINADIGSMKIFFGKLDSGLIEDTFIGRVSILQVAAYCPDSHSQFNGNFAEFGDFSRRVNDQCFFALKGIEGGRPA